MKCTKILLKKFYESDLDKVIIAIKKNDIKRIKWYNKVGNFNFNKYNENGDTPALIAVRGNKYEIAKYIFTRAPNLIKEDKTSVGDTALMLATFNGDLEMVKLLVEKAKLDVNFFDSLAIKFCRLTVRIIKGTPRSLQRALIILLI